MCAGAGDGAPGKISSSALAAGFFPPGANRAPFFSQDQECRVIIFASSDGQSAPHRVSEGQFLSEGRAPYEKFCPTAATVASYPIRARRRQFFLRGARAV